MNYHSQSAVGSPSLAIRLLAPAAATFWRALVAIFLISTSCVESPPDHGWRLIVDIEQPNPKTPLKEQERLEITKILQTRFGQAFSRTPVVTVTQENRLQIVVPGLREEQVSWASNLVTMEGNLEFHWVHEKSDELTKLGVVAPGYVLMKRTDKDASGSSTTREYLVGRKPADGITGRDFELITADRGKDGQYQVSFKFDQPGSVIFARLTRENVGRQLAILLDGNLRSAPIIKSEIPTGRGVISGGPGGFSEQEANELACVVRNPLPLRLRILQAQSY